MRFIFKTSYEQDIRLAKHGGQVFWYSALLLFMFAAPWLLPEYWLAQLTFVLIYSVVGLGLMLLALRQPWQERLVGGLDQVYRLHKWAGIAAAIAMALHYWGFKEFLGDGLKATFGRAGKPARDAVLSFATDWRGLGKDVGEWAMYALLALIVLRFIIHALFGQPALTARVEKDPKTGKWRHPVAAQPKGHHRVRPQPQLEIGRASCRERVSSPV